jgi:tetratricopeptide (TPR) repeat protein
MQYKRTTKGIDQIGRELGVNYVVEGAVWRDGSRVRITAQLIRVSDQTHVWAHGYERELQDVLLLQSELASAIATEVQVKLVPPAKSPAAGRRVNPEAYEACLKARFFWNRRSRHDLYRALEFFSSSIEKDRDYAPAFAGLADTYLVLLDYRDIPPNEALALATGAAVNALRIDERLADAHTFLGHAKLHALDWEGAEQEFQKAIGPETRSDLDGGEANLAILHNCAGRYDEALELCRKAIQTEPNLAYPYDDLGRTLIERGFSAEAITALEKAVFTFQSRRPISFVPRVRLWGYWKKGLGPRNSSGAYREVQTAICLLI